MDWLLVYEVAARTSILSNILLCSDGEFQINICVVRLVGTSGSTECHCPISTDTLITFSEVDFLADFFPFLLNIYLPFSFNLTRLSNEVNK